jgi:hypothetical protein
VVAQLETLMRMAYDPASLFRHTSKCHLLDTGDHPARLIFISKGDQHLIEDTH